jgi:hypothetical protein
MMEVDSNTGGRLVTDFTIANTLCATAMNGQLNNHDYYEDMRAKDKERKYKVTIENEHSILIPFVVTALGKWHRTALSFFKKMATHNITRKGLVRIYMASTIQQRNHYALLQYKIVRAAAISNLSEIAHMPAVHELSAEY